MKIKLILTTLLCLVLCNRPASAQTVIASGTCGDNLTWTLTEEGILTISGTGEMDDYLFEDHAPWIDYPIRSVVITEGVTRIGAWAFESCPSLTSVTIPESVTRIGEATFYNCSSLTSVTMPEVWQIEDWAFESCLSLTSVTMPTVTNIGGEAFKDCSSLTSITIPGSLTIIGDGAFEDCSSLVSATILEGANFIGWGIFKDCSSLTSVTLPESVTEIGPSNFMYCSSLVSVTMPGATKIWASAFSGCSSLVSIIIPENMTNIARNAFAGCSVRSVVWNAKALNNHVGDVADGEYLSLPDYGLDQVSSITFGEHVESLPDSLCKDCNLREIRSHAVKVPEIDQTVFDGVDKNIPLYVPEEGYADYIAHLHWSEFLDIRKIEDYSGLEDVVSVFSGITVQGREVTLPAGEADLYVHVYDMSGRHVLGTSERMFTLPESGTYLITASTPRNGTPDVMKLVVR